VIQLDFSQNQPATITLNTGSSRALVDGGLFEASLVEMPWEEH
jgi:hypothetical protein